MKILALFILFFGLLKKILTVRSAKHRQHSFFGNDLPNVLFILSFFYVFYVTRSGRLIFLVLSNANRIYRNNQK